MQDPANYVRTILLIGSEFKKGTQEIVDVDFPDIPANLHKYTRALTVLEDLVTEKEGLLTIRSIGLGGRKGEIYDLFKRASGAELAKRRLGSSMGGPLDAT